MYQNETWHLCAWVKSKRKERLVSHQDGAFGFVYQIAQSFTKGSDLSCSEKGTNSAYFGTQKELFLISPFINIHTAARTGTLKTHLLSSP